MSAWKEMMETRIPPQATWMNPSTKTARIPFDALPRRKRKRQATSAHDCRNLAVEHLS